MSDDLEQKKPSMRSIRYGEWSSAEYQQLLESVYREQAALILQRALRKKRVSEGKKVSHPIADPVTKSNSLFKVIQEPTDYEYKKHIFYIKSQQYALLDFDDPEFVRNIYKCLRLGEINLNQMHMALQMYQAQQWLKPDENDDYPKAGQFHTFRYDDPSGPYQAKKEIPFARPEQVTQFYASLEKPEDQTYRTINFTKYEEYSFFKVGLLDYAMHDNKKFKEMLIQYVSKLSESLQKDKVETYLKEEEAGDTTGRWRIQKYIDMLLGEETVRAYETQYRNDPLRDSMPFLFAGLSTGEYNPTYGLSPDYNPLDENSPTICFLLTSLEAENHLQRAVFGEEAALAALTAGRLTMRMISALVDRPLLPEQKEKSIVRVFVLDEAQKLALSAQHPSVAQVMQSLHGHQYAHLNQPARPVEITHPDLIKTDYPHELMPCDFLLTWHDRYHTWRCGSNFKKAIQHEKALLSRRGICQKQDFVMTHPLWLLSDMDLGYGTKIREYPDEVDFLVRDFFSRLLGSARGIDENQDIFLLNFIDMIKNPAVWDSFLPSGVSCSSVRELLTKDDYFLSHPLAMAYKDDALISVIENNKEKSTESIILRCKLRNLPDASQLCDMVDQIGLEKIMMWTMNGGLQITPALSSAIRSHFGVDKILLDDLHTPEALASVLKIAIHVLGDEAQRKQIQMPEPVRPFTWRADECSDANTAVDRLIRIAQETKNENEVNEIIENNQCDEAVASAILLNRKVFPTIKTIEMLEKKFDGDEKIALLAQYHPVNRGRYGFVSRADMLLLARFCSDSDILERIVFTKELSNATQLALLENKAITNEQLIRLVKNNTVSKQLLLQACKRISADDSFELAHAIFSSPCFPKKIPKEFEADVIEKRRALDNFMLLKKEVIDALGDNTTYPVPTLSSFGLFSSDDEWINVIARMLENIKLSWRASQIESELGKSLNNDGAPSWHSNRVEKAKSALALYLQKQQLPEP